MLQVVAVCGADEMKRYNSLKPQAREDGGRWLIMEDPKKERDDLELPPILDFGDLICMNICMYVTSGTVHISPYLG